MKRNVTYYYAYFFILDMLDLLQSNHVVLGHDLERGEGVSGAVAAEVHAGEGAGADGLD